MKIALAVPVIENCPAENLGPLMAQAVETSKLGEFALFTPVNEMPHDRARNLVFTEALEAECDLLYFIDDDTLVPSGSIRRLYDTLIDLKAAVVSGHYYRRGWPYTCVWSKEIETKGVKNFFQVDAPAGTGTHEIHTSGLGCALIDLNFVKAHLKSPWCEMTPGPKHTVVTDDTSFLTKVRQAGGLILGHSDVRCVHLGGRTPVCDETVRLLRGEYARTQQGNLPPSVKQTEVNNNGNNRIESDSERWLGDAGDASAEVRLAEESSNRKND